MCLGVFALVLLVYGVLCVCFLVSPPNGRMHRPDVSATTSNTTSAPRLGVTVRGAAVSHGGGHGLSRLGVVSLSRLVTFRCAIGSVRLHP